MTFFDAVDTDGIPICCITGVTSGKTNKKNVLTKTEKEFELTDFKVVVNITSPYFVKINIKLCFFFLHSVAGGTIFKK